MPKKRHATLTLDGPEDQSVTFLADFDQLTFARTQVGGYQREPNSTKAITPAAAEAFWKQLDALVAKGLREGNFNVLDGVVWKFKACDGKNTHEASGVILDGMIIDDEWVPDSYEQLSVLFQQLGK
jgi:hypothetical protein